MLFISNRRLKLAKSQANAKQHRGWTFAIWNLFTFFIHVANPKIIGHILKNKQKNKCVCIHEFMWLIIMKMKNRLYRYGINRSRAIPGRKYSKYKKCLSMMMLTWIKQHPSYIWSSIYENVKQHWDWVEKKRCIQKKACR